MTQGKLTTVQGDVTNPQKTCSNELIFIPHCCNNGGESGIGVMGAGVALALRKKWTCVYTAYKTMEAESLNGLRNRLGEISYAKTTDENIVVVNMIAQNGTVSAENPKPIKYWALMKCMEEVKALIGSLIVQYGIDQKPVIHAPEFGGLRAGGNFDFILELIREQWLEWGIDVVIYKFKK